MSAAALFWPSTGRLEAVAAFPTKPNLADRGQADGVSGRYVEMAERGELVTLGDTTVPVDRFIASVVDRLGGQSIAAIVGDRFRHAEFLEALRGAGLDRVPGVWRGMGWRDGSEDVERFRRALFEGRVSSAPSLLLRSAFADAITLVDPAGNHKLVKGRSTGRIDAAAATVLAVAQGMRMVGAPKGGGGRVAWG
jgi:phage terminase large subunit-like protein